MLYSLCVFFRKLPSEILAEDAELLQLMKIYQLGFPGKDSQGG